MGSIQEARTDFNIIIVGAGISGINAAYRLQTQLPNHSYTILEARGALGGTWDLFRYPGIRSDSDLHTFGFPWRPWYKTNPIADGESIRSYMKECAEMYGIDRNISYHHRVLAADWSSDAQQWCLSVDANGEKKFFTARFLIMGTGYYNYAQPLEADIPGLKNFQGQTVHPQFWPEDLDYTGKKIVVIGSGATAITLIPSLVEKAEKVTMLQRSPSYIVALPQKDPMADFLRRWLPASVAHQIVRIKFLLLPYIFFQFCRNFPNAARKQIAQAAKMEIPEYSTMDPDFKPRYNPWDQRLCVCPDGDFYQSIKSGKANVVTDHIASVNAHSITTKSGKTIDADIIVTATGLKMQMAGGTKLSIDGEPINIPDKFIWRGVMLQDMPNAAFVIGYTNASWTLGADTTAQLLVRLLKHMDRNGLTSAVARAPAGAKINEKPVLNLTSTYIVKAKGTFPKAGDVAPWLPRTSYFSDYPSARWGNVTGGLEFVKSEKKVA